MANNFALIPITIEDLEAAESSTEFSERFLAKDKEHIIEFNASNKRCNDYIYGQVLVSDGTIKNIFLERTGCSLSRASIVSFAQQMLNADVQDILGLTDNDFLQAIGTSHPMRNECVLFGIKELIKALSDKNSLS